MSTFLKRFIFINPLQKLLALGCAIIIWVFAPSTDKKNLTEIQFFVPVTYVNLPKNLEITSKPLQSVSVSVEAARSELPAIHPSLFQVVIDLEDASVGSLDFEISGKALKIPDNVRVISISPNVLELTFEEVVEKTLPIKPVFVGKLSTGYVLEKVTMIPASLIVKGPVSVLSAIEQLETRAINIENVSSDIDLLVQIAFPNRVTPVEPKPEYYAAKILIGSEPINVRYLNIPIGIVNQTYVTRINPKSFNVLLRGPRSIMEHFEKQDIQAFIDLKDYPPGTYKIDSPSLRIRPEIQIEKIWPPIDIWVKKEKIE